MATGKVKTLNTEKEFGFITPDDASADLYMHSSSITGGINSLSVGDNVKYEASTGPKGPLAQNVVKA